MNDLEAQLAGLPLRSAPPGWRGDMLRTARNVARPTNTPAWWRAWLTPQPIALAAAWLVIAFLALSTPEESTPPPPATLAQWEQHLQLQQEMLAETSRSPINAVPAARLPNGAAIAGRRGPFA